MAVRYCAKSEKVDIISYYVSKYRNTIAINLVWPSDAIWQHRSGSTSVQAMAC